MSATASGDGRESTSPIAPSSSWWVISTTVRRKFGSSSDGDETSSLPASESIAAGSQVTRSSARASAATPASAIAMPAICTRVSRSWRIA